MKFLKDKVRVFIIFDFIKVSDFFTILHIPEEVKSKLISNLSKLTLYISSNLSKVSLLFISQ